MTYWFYFAALQTRERGTAEAHKLRLVRSVLDRLATEIRQASAVTTNGRVGIRGEAERIWLFTQRVPSREAATPSRAFDEQPLAESDMVKVEYKIARHPEILHEDGYPLPLGLARVELLVPRADSAQTGEAFDGHRRRIKSGAAQLVGSGRELTGGSVKGADQASPAATPGKDSALAEDAGEPVDEAMLDEEFFGGRVDPDGTGPGTDVQWEELYAPEIRFLRFCYYDGHKWWDDWDVRGDNPLPQLVQVTVGFGSCAPFDGEFVSKEIEDFCECLNHTPADCLPLPRDRYSTVVRVPQADPLFRSRITRETQAYIKQVKGEP